MRRPDIHRLAELELNRAARSYEDERTGLGVAFLDEMEHCVESIMEFPMAGPEIAEGVRRRLLRRFPFGLLYTIKPDRIRILAVMHLKRDPDYWVGRT